MSGLLEWREEYALGIAEVDYEHREMIELINELYASLTAGANVEEIAGFLAEVHARIAAHFALEESLMQRIAYPAYAAHKDDHERLLDDILDLLDRVEARGAFDADELARRLDDWFTIHSRNHDARLHAFVG